jgi:uncharacterized protein
VPDFYVTLLFVFCFSIIQSIIGIGLLVFGTPTFLLLGYSFEATLTYLLPASIGISSLQIMNEKKHIKLRKDFLIFTVPFIMLGLFIALTKPIDFNLKHIISILLLLTGTLRLFPTLQDTIKRFLKSNMKIYMIILGAIHGVSNMGGGLLTILASTLFNNKNEIRVNIAYGYLIFALTQITVLAFYSPHLFSWFSVIFPVISISTYTLIGNIVYKKASEVSFRNLITIFTFAYGIVLFVTI